jgi:GNAT superfamily N-acetyltransferase
MGAVEILVRHPRVADEEPCVALATLALGEAAARHLVASHFREHRIVVAEAAGAVVGLLAWREDWFDCSFVSLVFVREDFRRRGIAREMFRAVESQSRSPRIFSSVEEDNADAIRMHAALGFRPSGQIDNLPQGRRELLFFKRVPPRGRAAPEAASPN